MKFAIVVSRFNQSITQKLLNGALGAFKKHKIADDAVRVDWVPGAFELPFAAKALAETGRFSAVVCLGCVLQGETQHHHYIAQSAAQAIQDVSLATGVPIAFGVLTPSTLKQAQERSGDNSANKGVEAAEAAIEMAELARGLKKKS